MLWHRQAVFNSKGDTLSSSAEYRIRSWGVWDYKSPPDRMPMQKPNELLKIKQKLELNSPSPWWVSIQPTWLHCWLAFRPGPGDIHDVALILIFWQRQAILHSRGEKLSFSAECRIRSWEVWDTKSPADWISTHKSTVEDQAKTWSQQPVPMMSEHSAYLALLPISSRTWLCRFCWMQDSKLRHTYMHIYIYIYIYIHIDIHYAVFVWWSGTGKRFSIRKETNYLPLLNTGFEQNLEQNLQQTECPLTNWLGYRDQTNKMNSIASPFDQRAYSPLDPTADWLLHLALAIFMFVVVNFDALAQGGDFRIGRRQVVFLCWMQDSNPGSLEPNHQQTECPLTNQLSYGGSS